MNRLFRALRRLVLLTLLAAAVYASTVITYRRPDLPPRDGLALASVATWGYQLQNTRPDRIAAGIDLLVIDGQRHNDPPRMLSPHQVEQYRTRPDGTRRIVLAYLSIGEAESYRPYWWSHWAVLPPRWLGSENKTWRSNYLVRYWDPGWRRLIVHSNPTVFDRAVDAILPGQRPYIDQILEAGFDGVYLDRVDAFYEWRTTQPGAEAAMVALVAELSDYAKSRRPGFLVVPQNGEELLRNVGYRRKIDAVAKEDLVFGADHQEGANPADSVTASIRYLNMARAERLPVFAVEYLEAPEKRRQASERLRGLGIILTFAHRALNEPPEWSDGFGDQPVPSTERPSRPKG